MILTYNCLKAVTEKLVRGSWDTAGNSASNMGE